MTSIRAQAFAAFEAEQLAQEQQRIEQMEAERLERVMQLQALLRSELGQRVPETDIQYTSNRGAFWVSDNLRFEVDDEEGELFVMQECQSCHDDIASPTDLLYYQPSSLAGLGRWLNAHSRDLCAACEERLASDEAIP